LVENRIYWLGWTAVILGLITVLSMAMLYLLPTQEAWYSNLTLLSYLRTTFLLGVITISALLVLDLKIAMDSGSKDLELRSEIMGTFFPKFALIGILCGMTTLVIDWQQVVELDGGSTAARTSLDLLLGLYFPLLLLRYFFLLSGLILFCVSVYVMSKNFRQPAELLNPFYLACLLILISEILERFLFYATHVRIGI
jgi:anaerobic dimethyl sulfoxide reductase subunit C